MADPSDDRPLDRRTVGIVGAGTMGAGIAQVALEAGEWVLIADADPEAVLRAFARIRGGLERRRRKAAAGQTGTAALGVDEAMARLAAEPDLQRLAAASDVVIEAAVEDLAVKRAIFAGLDAAARPSTTLATNTSALSVAAIAAATHHPSRVIGLHFFNPAPLMALVEVVATPDADPVVVDRAVRLMADWGKTPVRTADSPGFIVNRVNRPFTLEALRMLELGLGSVGTIDGAVRSAGYPMGPFELMDLVGIDVNLAAARGIFEAFHYEPRFRPSVIQERLVEAGRFGRKTGEGFYWYGEDGRSLGVAGAFATEPPPVAGPESPLPALPSGVTSIDPLTETGQIAERVDLAIVNEAYRALGDRIATPDDIDLALRLGAGHPLGPFERAAAMGGPGVVLERLERWRSAGPRFAPASALVAAARAAP
jgi:3-hydroxybutyryl-CoA dehydrogenase